MKKIYFQTFLLMWLGACGSDHPQNDPAREFDVQGHRGYRGLYPENSIAGFIKALELGVNTLEMDVVISQDHKVVLSHEPFMSPVICLDSSSLEIPPAAARSYNLFRMNYGEIQKFDCGSKGNPEFPQQRAMYTVKPLLSQVFKAVEQHAAALGIPPPFYNIETKSNPAGDGLYHPPPSKFVALLLETLRQAAVQDRVIIQSFDPRTLQAARTQAPGVKLALLIENRLTPHENLDILGFHPHIYSPEHLLIDRQSLDYLQGEGIKVIPWTVNETADMQKYLEMGVAGIITDYPHRMLKLLGRLK